MIQTLSGGFDGWSVGIKEEGRVDVIRRVGRFYHFKPRQVNVEGISLNDGTRDSEGCRVAAGLAQESRVAGFCQSDS